jgi:hypothetical protein
VRDHISDAELALILEALRETAERKRAEAERLMYDAGVDEMLHGDGYLKLVAPYATKLRADADHLLELARDLAELETP